MDEKNRILYGASMSIGSQSETWTVPRGHNRRTAPTRNKILCIAVVLLSLPFLLFLGVIPIISPLEDAIAVTIADTHTSDTSWDWATIKPSRSLVWHNCYDDELECARLDVPMDWLDQSDDLRVIIAVARLRANVSTTDENYKGTVIFNPGGPGGSGIWALKDHGALLQTIVGANHDILTFDPRGIGASIPRADCWAGDQVRRALWSLQDVPVIDAHPGILYDAFSRARAFSSQCESEIGGERGLLAHLSTASHARDMLEIVDLLGEGGLKYWGFSYGTILGGTFAAMYPDRVERLVSDGNVDYREWYLGSHVNFLRDTDKVMDAFYEFCFEAGPLKCAIHADSPELIRDRVKTLQDKLRTEPIIVANNNSRGTEQQQQPLEMPYIVTYSELKKATSPVLYRPINKFESFSKVLLSLEQGDGRPLYDFMGKGEALSSSPSSMCPVESVPPGIPAHDLAEDTDDAFPAIMCSDAEPLTESVEEFSKYAAQLQEISTAMGAFNVLFRIACAGRRTRPKWRYAGPFEGETKHPILYIANMADNVTPLISARNNSAGFPGSVILKQNSYGHTSLAAPSTCTAAHIRAYFQNGTLPAPESECEPDEAPFGIDVPGAGDEYDATTAALGLAVRGISNRATWIDRPSRRLF